MYCDWQMATVDLVTAIWFLSRFTCASRTYLRLVYSFKDYAQIGESCHYALSAWTCFLSFFWASTFVNRECPNHRRHLLVEVEQHCRVSHYSCAYQCPPTDIGAHFGLPGSFLFGPGLRPTVCLLFAVTCTTSIVLSWMRCSLWWASHPAQY